MLPLTPNITIAITKKSCILVIALIVLTLSASMFIGGVYTKMKYKPLGASSTILAHRNDTILLAEAVDSFWHANITVQQCVQKQDDYHDSDLYVIASNEIVLKRTALLVQSPMFYQDLPTFKAGVQNYLYLLPGSTFIYRMCLASTTNQEQTATYFLFNNIEKYWDYIADTNSGKTNSILYKTLTAGKNNRTMCSEVFYNVTKPSYYFMVVNSPAYITYFYNFTLNKIEYDVSSFQSSCRVSDYNQCEVSIKGGIFKHTKYDVIAYVRPSPYEQSIITHLCIALFTGSDTLSKLSLISDSLFAVAAFLSFTVFAMFIYLVIVRLHKHFLHSELSERQKLLHEY